MGIVRKYQFETEMIHSLIEKQDHYKSLTPPIYQTSTFVFDNAEQGQARFSGEEEGFIYSRLSNPTVRELEQKLARLEKGEDALAFSSGMGAVSAVLTTLTKTGDHILCSKGVYGCTFGLLQMLKEKYNIQHSFHRLIDEEEIERAIQKNTTCIYVETPINPTMEIIHLEAIVRVAKKYSIPVVVDNTFSSPYLQNPLTIGCDVVIHSATKYICGHGDVIAGIAVGRKEFIQLVSNTARKDIGATISPFDAWLLLRGLKTLSIRMDRHCENAMKIAEQLTCHPAVEDVYYPYLPEHPQYELAKKQMSKGGGLITFKIKGADLNQTQQFMNSLELIKIAVSLGDAETLIQHPATMTHAVVDDEEKKRMGITNNMVRLSIGLEAWQDIWFDLEQALGLKKNKPE
ncbi:methionine gamma-lyase [Bacillus sp. FJAT-47783]|uniref:methionine gamma-lyase n=1 Tax=Bacillus sp. FJAT-47783 TaxID=2922712 RepID=UPI001FABF47F|nr:methionine gamma-lyase [Bacillus sp. FJAT-47783]